MTGRRFVCYAGVAVGGVISVYANIAEKYVNNPSPALDGVVLSAAAPVVLFLMSEILIAVTGNDVPAWAVRVSALTVSVVAFVTSYQHLHDLLLARGDSELTARIYPFGIDGLLIGATAVLWQMRTRANPATVSVPERTSPALGDSDPLLTEPARPAVAAARHEPAKVTSRTRPKAPTSRKPTDDDLAALLRAAIASGDLPAEPSNNSVRLRYGINNSRATRVIDRATASMEATS